MTTSLTTLFWLFLGLSVSAVRSSLQSVLRFLFIIHSLISIHHDEKNLANYEPWWLLFGEKNNLCQGGPMGPLRGFWEAPNSLSNVYLTHFLSAESKCGLLESHLNSFHEILTPSKPEASSNCGNHSYDFMRSPPGELPILGSCYYIIVFPPPPFSFSQHVVHALAMMFQGFWLNYELHHRRVTCVQLSFLV